MPTTKLQTRPKAKPDLVSGKLLRKDADRIQILRRTHDLDNQWDVITKALDLFEKSRPRSVVAA